MQTTLKIAKFLMNLMPKKPTYDAVDFRQEVFMHPNYKSLSDEAKKKKMIKWIDDDCIKASKKCFEQYFPNFFFESICRDKTVLDLGCSIGGQTIYFAEKYYVKNMYGIDVNKESVIGANMFVRGNKKLNASYKFLCGYAEELPFDDNTFDAIISHDTIEHVRSVKQTLEQCKRITKHGGHIFLVFPSYYCPFGGAHINSVTNTPFLEWFFSAYTLNKACQEIQSDWGNDYSWYRHKDDIKYPDWATVKGGIGVNGITYKEFDSIINEIGFSETKLIRTPLLSVGFMANRYPIIKYVSNSFKPLLKIRSLIDYLSHRIVYHLRV